MATCPKCGGYLGRRHRCWGSRRRLTSIWLALVGAAAGLLIPWLVIDRPAELLLLVTAVLGSVLILAVRRYARF